MSLHAVGIKHLEYLRHMGNFQPEAKLSPEHVSGAENGVERAENGMSGCGAVSGC